MSAAKTAVAFNNKQWEKGEDSQKNVVVSRATLSHRLKDSGQGPKFQIFGLSGRAVRALGKGLRSIDGGLGGLSASAQRPIILAHHQCKTSAKECRFIDSNERHSFLCAAFSAWAVTGHESIPIMVYNAFQRKL